MPTAPQQQVLIPPPNLKRLESCWQDTPDRQLILSVCRTALEAGSAPETIWVHGPRGIGKTHLALRAQRAFAWDYFELGEVAPESASEFLESLALDRPVIFDGLDHWLGQALSEAALFSWWKRREAVALVLAKRSPRTSGLFQLPDLASRALATHILPLGGLTDAQLLALWRCQLLARDLELAPEVVRFIEPRLPRSPARLVHLVAMIDAESLRDQRKITVPWLRQWLVSAYAKD